MSRRQRRAMLHRGRTSARGNGKAQVWTNGTPSDAHVVAWRAHREGRIRRAHALWIRGNIGAVKAMGLLKEAKNYRPECRTTAELLAHGAYLVRRRALRPASPQPAARYRYRPQAPECMPEYVPQRFGPSAPAPVFFSLVTVRDQYEAAMRKHARKRRMMPAEARSVLAAGVREAWIEQYPHLDLPDPRMAA